MSDLRPRSNRSAHTAGIARHGQLKRSGPWPTILKFLGAALVVALVSGASLGAIVFSQIKSNITTVTLVSEETEGPPPSIGAYSGGFNILIVGSDVCEDDSGCAGRGSANLNDVTMLLHVSADQTNAVAVSIPRDLVVRIPSCPQADGTGTTSEMSGRPINETLYYGGLPCTVLTVEALTGLDIQFAGLITFNGVIQMSSAVGGVDVCIDGPINDRYSGFKVDAAGTYNLSGTQALAFLRTRHGVGDGSDLTRISSQQVYLSSLVRTLKSSETLGDPVKIYNLAKAATSNMTLSQNFSNLDTLASIALALKDIPLENVTFVQYPGTTGVGGLYQGKVAPVKAKADALFELIRSDTPFTLTEAGDGRGAAADPNAPVPPVADPAAPVDPAVPVDPNAAATAPPATPLEVLDIRGQTAADHTCSVANN